MNEASNEILRITLKQLQISNPKMELEIIDSAGPIKEDNMRVYGVVNQTLDKMLDKEKISESYHVTGEMNAIADPRHRKVCRKLYKKFNETFQMAAWLPKKYRYNGTLFLKRIIENWDENTSWQNYLDSIYLVGNREIDIFAQDEMEKIHYSVFNDNLILLQSEHGHHEHKKNVWFINSNKLNEELKPRAINSAKNAEKLNPLICREVVDSISSPLALDILYNLEEREISTDKFKEKFEKEHNSSNSIENLTTFGFVRNNESYEITDSGIEYLKLYN